MKESAFKAQFPPQLCCCCRRRIFSCLCRCTEKFATIRWKGHHLERMQILSQPHLRAFFFIPSPPPGYFQTACFLLVFSTYFSLLIRILQSWKTVMGRVELELVELRKVIWKWLYPSLLGHHDITFINLHINLSLLIMTNERDNTCQLEKFLKSYDLRRPAAIHRYTALPDASLSHTTNAH